MAFPQTPLTTITELNLGGVWTDITHDVYDRDPITITRGQPDESPRCDAGTCTLTLNNRSGTYSPRNPLSSLYGLIGRNTPVRVSVAAGSPWLGVADSTAPAARVSTPSTTALNILGDLDVRFDVQPLDWDSGDVVELGGKWGAAGQRAWVCYLFAGQLRLSYTTDGTTSVTNLVSLASAELRPRMVVRAVLDVNNGSGGHTVRFYVGLSMTGPWTQVGADVVTAGTTATASTTAPVEIGDVSGFTATANAAARLYAAQIRSGIDGTIVANPDFTAQTAAALTFTDSAGVSWTANSTSAITNRRVRFLGEISAWPPRWDVSGKDVYVPVQASGITRRLGAGSSPLQSTLARAVPADPSILAYWPMEDGQGATQAYSPIPGVSPLRTSGLTFGADDSLAGSNALPTLAGGATIAGGVPGGASTGEWHVEFVYKIETAPAGDPSAQLLTVLTTNSTWRIGVGASAIHVDVTALDGTTNLSSLTITPPTGFFGVWSRLLLEVSQSGSLVSYTLVWINVGGDTFGSIFSYTGTIGVPTGVRTTFDTALDGMSFGHLAVFNTLDPTAFDQADTGYDGETADVRLARLTTEESVPLVSPFGHAGTAAMGPQRSDTFLNLCGDAAAADRGILYEHRDSVALAYRPRISLYNQPVALALDYSADGEVAPPLEPVEDDTATRNDVTVTRQSGSSARATLGTGTLSTLPPPSGVGPYPTSETVNVHSDEQLPDVAGWILHLGTWDGPRYPAVSVDLAAAPWLIDQATAADVGDRIQISHPPAWLPPEAIDLLGQGYTETIGQYDWGLTFNCTAAGPWTVGIIEDAARPARFDTDACQLATGVNSTATSWSVTTTHGPRWVDSATYPAEFPMDWMVAGERVTVTAISGTGTTQTATVVRAVNGIHKAQSAGASIALADPTYIAL